MNAPLFEVCGARVTRLEDYRLLTGDGKFAADWNLSGQLYGHFLRHAGKTADLPEQPY